MKTDFSKTVFILHFDKKGFPFVTTDTLENRVSESAEETTSPRGVEPKLFVEGTDLKYWEIGGHARLVESFDTKEEAEQEWLERTYEYDYLNSSNYSDDYDTEEDALQAAAEMMEVSREVLDSIMHHHELYRQAESKRRAERMMASLKKAKENANGKLTKKLEQAVDACSSNGYMYGSSDHWSGNAELDTQKYYTEEFIRELNRLKSEIHQARHIKYLRSNLLYAVATWNADPYCVETDEQVEEIIDEVLAHGSSLVTDEDERASALRKLDLPADSKRSVFRAGGCLWSYETMQEANERMKK